MIGGDISAKDGVALATKYFRRLAEAEHAVAVIERGDGRRGAERPDESL